jgi:hypothetical protein
MPVLPQVRNGPHSQKVSLPHPGRQFTIGQPRCSRLSSDDPAAQSATPKSATTACPTAAGTTTVSNSGKPLRDEPLVFVAAISSRQTWNQVLDLDRGRGELPYCFASVVHKLTESQYS